MQALEVIKLLKDSIPIEKAQMRIRILLPKDCAKKTREKLLPSIANVESEDWDCGQLEMVDKYVFRTLLISTFFNFLQRCQ